MLRSDHWSFALSIIAWSLLFFLDSSETDSLDWDKLSLYRFVGGTYVAAILGACAELMCKLGIIWVGSSIKSSLSRFVRSTRVVFWARDSAEFKVVAIMSRSGEALFQSSILVFAAERVSCLDSGFI